MHTWKKIHLNHALFHCCKNFDTTIITDANDKTVMVQICAERGGRTWYWKRETLTPLSCLPLPPPPPPFLRHSFKKPHYHYGWNWPFLSLINVIIKGTNSCLLSSLF